MCKAIHFYFVVGLLSLKGASGEIMCFSCTSADNEACNDPMGYTDQIKCHDDYCTKITYISPYGNISATSCPDNHQCNKVTISARPNLMISRGCNLARRDFCGSMQENMRNHRLLSEFSCSTCQTDYCNSVINLRGPSDRKSLIAFVLLLINLT